MRIDPDLRGALPIVLIVLAGFLAGVSLLVIAVLTGP